MDRPPPDDDAPTLPRDVTASLRPVSLPVAADTTDANTKDKVAPPRDAPDLPGYEIQGVLGQGGMGVVYRAREVCLNRPVAIKVLRAGPDIDEEERRRFQTEAEAVARLQHPGIVQVFHFGEQSGQPYLVMELVEGGTLARHTAGQPLQGRVAAGLVEQLARAMHHAHQRGVIHRDLKPANVLLAGERRGVSPPVEDRRADAAPLAESVPKIGDFGLAKQLDRRHPLTLPSVAVLGTPGYMAPEQAGGLAHEVGPRTDVYGLGAVLYECLTGRPPFQGPHLEVLRQVQEEDPPPPSALAPRVHRDLETICLKAMHKLPGRRYGSAVDLADDLARYLAGEPIQGRREALASRLWRRVRRRLPAIGLVTGLLAAVVMAVVLRLAAVREQRRTDLLGRADRTIENCDGSPDGVREANALLAELDAEGLTSQAEQRRGRLVLRCSSRLEQALRAPRLAHDDVERLQSALDALASLAPEAAAQWRQELDGRLRHWEEAFDLKPPLPALHVPFRSAAEMEAWSPDGGWQPGVGLVLDHSTDPEKPQRYSFHLARVNRSARLQVLRNQVVLREKVMPAPQKTVHLRARRDGDRLTLQLDDRPPLEVFDPFPLPEPGRFALSLPAGAAVERVRGQHLLQARRPSPLERGDEALAAGRADEALGHYQSQARDAAGAARHEALYKQALCLERLRRPDEAAALLERLGGQAGPRWRVPALCRLWLLEVRRDRHAEADAVLRGLATDYRFEQLAVFVPDNERREMLEASHPGGTFDLLRHNPYRIRDLERALEAERLLGAPAKRQAQTKYELMQVCMVEGQNPRAISLAEELAADKALSADNRVDSILDLASLLCQGGQTHRALDEINRHLLAGDPGRYRTAYLPLLLARARVHALMDRSSLAEKDLDDLFRLTADPGRATGYLDACLLRGVLRSDRGDADGAAAAWREGLNLARRTESMHVLSAAIMGSLLNELTTADLKEMIAGVLGGTRSSSPIVMLFRSGLFPFDELATGLRATWRSPRGREYARRIALRDLPYREMLTVQMVLGVFEGCRAGAFPAGLTPEQDELLWRLFRDVAEAQWTGELAHQQAVQILTAWNGATGSLGWAGLASKLKPSIRGPMAYVMGHRYLRLRKPDEAKTFFRAALADAARESVLARLAAAELERMK